MYSFERTDLNASAPVEVEGLLSALVRSGPQRQRHQVPPYCDPVTPHFDSWCTRTHLNIFHSSIESYFLFGTCYRDAADSQVTIY